MKKVVAVLLAALMILSCTAALAENIKLDKLTFEFVPSKDADVIITGTKNLPELVQAEMAKHGYDIGEVDITVGTSYEATGEAMCAGAIVNARIPRVVYGAGDAKSGAVRSVCGLFDMGFNHHPKVESGILEEACGALLTEFFQKLRVELRARPRWKPQNQGTSD